MIISVLCKHGTKNFAREMPRHLRNHFILGSTQGADFLVVYDGISSPVDTTIPATQSMVILPEPPSIKSYNSDFLRQFGHVLTVDDRIRHPGRILGWSTMTWFYGLEFSTQGVNVRQSFNSICEEETASAKSRFASIVVSDKVFTKDQKFRLEFVDKLTSFLGENLDVFGRQRNPIADKRDAILPYKFHFALENSCVPHYFTEKLLDSFLGGAFPIYRGAPNIFDYFAPNSLTLIPHELTPHEAAQFAANEAKTINYTDRSASLATAKQKTLSTYNFFESTLRWANELSRFSGQDGKVSRRIQPEQHSLLDRFRAFAQRR